MLNVDYLERCNGNSSIEFQSLMENEFDVLINSFLSDRIGIDEHFLSVQLAAQLKENLRTLDIDRQFVPAGIGNKDIYIKDSLIRGDRISWLNPENNFPHEQDFFKLMDRFVWYLNSTCYAGIKAYEFHYAIYDSGSFYKKHLDQFKSDQSRSFSMIMYLNSDWEKRDGGELVIYQVDNIQTISPMNGKCVFFRSYQLEHEVLITNKTRISVTGWFKT